MKAIILGAGKGTRLEEETQGKPKILLDIAGKTILQRQCELLTRAGIKEVFLNLYFKHELVTDYLNDLNLQLKITTKVEKELSGTWGGVSLFREEVGFTPFFVLYGDILLDFDLANMRMMAEERGSEALIMAHQRSQSNSLMVIEDNSLIKAFIERPSEEERIEFLKEYPEANFVNSGVMIFKPSIFNYDLNDNGDIPRDLFPKLLEKKTLMAYKCPGKRFAIDSKARLEEARDYFNEE